MSQLSQRLANLSPEQIELLSRRLIEKGKKASSQQVIVRREQRNDCPLSFAQQRLWFLDQLEPGQAAYSMPLAVSVSGALRVAVLEQALGEIVRRHEALRTSFPVRSGEPRQQIAEAGRVEVPVTDLQGLGDERAWEEAGRLMRAEAGRPFDLGSGPVIRVRLLRLAEEEHVVLLTLHHIVSDGWSMGVLIREIATLYEAYNSGRPSPLAGLPIQYADFAHWQRELLQGEVLEAQLSYWRGQLAGAPPMLELPTDRPRPAMQSFRGATQNFAVSGRLTESLESLSRSEGATLFMTLMAAWQTLLSRYSGQTDIVVGSPIANRNRAEVEPLIGFFANALALRTDLSDNPTFKELLVRVRDVSLGAYAHQDLPFEMIVEDLEPKRHTDRSPLFQVVFTLQNAPTSALDVSNLRLVPLKIENVTAKFDLVLNMTMDDTGMAGSLEFSTALFNAESIARMLRHFQRLLQAVVADPEQRVSDLPLLTPDEQRQALVEWNDTRADYPQHVCIHQLFEAQAERTPEAVAVVFNDQHLSYRELNERAGQLANHLRAAGVRPGVYVGLYLEHSLEMIVGLLGVIKAGGAYVPLDPEHPASRLSFMIEDAQIPLILTQQTLVERLPEHSAKVLRLDTEWDAIAAAGDEASGGHATPEDVAYVIYTSGSTGQPKGVKIQHRALVNYIWWAKDVYLQNEKLSFPLYSSLAFDLTVTSIYTPLITGNQVFVYRPEAREPAIVKIVEEGQAEVLKLTPSHLALIADRDNSRSRVRRLIVGGEALETKLARSIHESFGGKVEILNEYGPTEATVGCMIYRFDPASDQRLDVPIGKPAANVEIYVLDDSLNPVAENVPGELYISGDGLAEGYLNREELTREKFIDNPFIPGRKMYRTGDLARRLVGGNIEYVGRRDEQVKFHGYRVELNEIKSALNRHPQVRDSIVTLNKDTNGHGLIVAYYVSRQEIEASVLREFLRGSIIEATIPNFFVHLKKLPLTLNGKVNKRALPSLDEVKGWVKRSFTAPRTPTEEALLSIWAEVLGVKAVGIHDNFFELGGHSLLTTQVLSRVREIFRVELALRSMFETPTPAGLAESIDGALKAGQTMQAPPLEPISREEALPLSYGQQRLWFLDQFSPDTSFYNIPSALRLSGDLNIPALEHTFSEIIRRHEVLRTTFDYVKSAPVQVIAPPQPLAVPVTDISRVPQPERDALASRLAAEEARRPFDLRRGPLLRASLLRLAPKEHVLLFTMHHIISDGWSMGVLVREVAAVYEAFAANKPSPLPELPIQYADYTVWQRRWLTDEVLDKQLDYWRGQLGGELPVLELPTDRARSLVQSHQGDAVTLQLSESLSRALKELSQREGTTLFMTLLAGWQLLLSRHSGQKQIIVGTPTAGRSQLQTEGLIGFFVNTLAMRLDLSGNPSVRELLHRVREVALGAYAHQDVPFDKLVEDLQPERNLSHQSIFQVMFSLEKKTPDVFEVPSLKLSGVPVETGVAKYDLTLVLEEQDSAIAGALEYNTDLFDRSTVEQLLAHFQTLLENAVADPEGKLSDISLLRPEEEHQLLVEWNRTRAEYPRHTCVHELFEQQAARTPDAVALVYGEQHLTYGALDRRANQLARYLRKLGVRPEARVGVLMERSAEMVVGLLAILKAGGAYVPLDLAYPRERLAYMVADSGAEVALVGGEREREVLGESGAHVVEMEAERARIASESGAPLGHGGATAEGLAYIIYTSGSTGTPKGVAVSHRAINRLLINTDYIKLSEQDRIAQAANSSFDAATFEIWGPLLHGARLIGFSKEVSLSPVDFAAQIVEQGVSGIFLTTALFNQMACHAAWGFRFVRDLLFGGEHVDPHWVREVLATAPPGRLLHVYGPTETTTFATWHPVRDVQPEATNVPIGRPLANTELYVLDENLQPVSVGMPGQLYIGGDGLARGYLNRPGLTAEKFVPHPFSAADGAQLYRTGDMVRYLPDGNIEFLGRADNQVKVRGFRIELGEIEAMLVQHEAVREAIVLAREDEPGDKRLVAYLVFSPQVASPETAPTPALLRAYLKERVPDYMIPSAFVVLDSLPLTPNGKVDRRALPAPTATTSTHHFLAPRTPLEALLADIWADVLGVERISADDDFFSLGGHSLLATQVISRLRHLVGVEVPLRALFESPTVSGLAARVEAAQRAALGVEAPPLVAAHRAAEPPLSFAQQRLWFLDQLEPGQAAYNMPLGVAVSGALRVAALEQALGEIVRRHEALRTSFPARGGEPRQQIAGAHRVEAPVTDLRGLSEERAWAEARRLAREEAGRPFDLGSGPLLRARLLRLDEEEHVALLTMHHIVSDGWSMGVLVQEVGTLYESYARGEASPLAELEVQYADYAMWQREWLRGEVLERQLAYWREQLADAPATLEMPTDYRRTALQRRPGATLEVRLSAELSAELKALSRGRGVTTFMTLLAGWQVLLSRYAGQERVSVGTPIAGRGQLQTEGLIGLFLNTLVIHSDLSGNPTFNELLERVRDVSLGAYAHQDVPFEKLVEELQPERSLTHSPLFQVMFTFQNAPQEELKVADLLFKSLSAETETAQFDLALSIGEQEGILAGSLEYNSDLFDRRTIELLLLHFQTLLENAVADPEDKLSDISLLRPEEEHQLLVEWNRTRGDYRHQRCIHELFEEQVERTPDAVALMHGERHLTYRELNRQANRLARHLRRRGIAVEDVIGLYLERSVEMMVGILGALKSGAAYVALDPLYPAGRLSFMLADAGVSLVLTREGLDEELPPHGAEVVCLDAIGETLAAEPSGNAPRRAMSDNTAYVVYTSGSTGQPKGVAVQHDSVVNYIEGANVSYRMGPSDRMLQFASFGFDVSAEETFIALTRGAALVLRTEEMLASASTFLGQLREWQVTAMELPTAYWHQITGEETKEEWGAARQLRMMIIGGERVWPERVGWWQEATGGRLQLFNACGPTEITIGATLFEVPVDGGVALRNEVPIGYPMPNYESYVLDGKLRPTPVGVAGEMYVGGVGVARGYLNRSGLTAEKFIPHPFSAAEGARLYRTGDMVRNLPDGNIEFLGRVDNQVKVRGFRIELGEIETVLVQHEAVHEAVVIVSDESEAGKRLVAYVVGEGGQELRTAALRSYLKERVPEYMVPAAFVVLDSLPLTTNGKVDRRALPALDQSRPDMEVTYIPPRTVTEELLAEIWSKTLGVELVGIHDNFFNLGGDSIRSLRIVALAKERGLNLSLQQLFQHQTIAELTQEISALEGQPGLVSRTRPFSLISDADRRMLPDDVEDAYPVTMLQAGMLFDSEYGREAALYHNTTSLHLRASFDLQALKMSIEQLLKGHAALRTSFDLATYSEPLQLVHQTVQLPLQVEDLRGIPEAEQERIIGEWEENEKQRPIDWTQPPLLRFHVHLRTEETFQFSFAEHHAILDGWSLAAMLTELFRNYLSFLKDAAEPAEPPKSNSFRDFVELERASLASEQSEQYWKQKLSGSNMLMLPRRPSPHGTSIAPQLYKQIVSLSAEISNGLKRLANLAGAPVKSVLLAAHLKVMGLLGGQSDVLTGLVSHGRPETADAEQVLGLFLNALPFRLPLEGGTWVDLARQTFDAERELLPFRYYPMAQMRINQGGQPLFETIFNFTHFHVYQAVAEIDGIEVLSEVGSGDTGFTLVADFGLDVNSSQVTLLLTGRSSELGGEQMEAIGGYYTAALTAMASEPAARYERQHLLAAREWQQTLVEWNDTRADLGREYCIHELFEAQVESAPEAVAVVFEDQQLTYRELNRRANQLARHLQLSGVGAEVLVGIMLERSVEMVVGLLGILKAGGAYVPLDPAYPQQRLAFMLDDAQTPVVLTQERFAEQLRRDCDAEIVALDTTWEVIARQSDENPPANVGFDNLAYMIYTSGSTGAPKGAMNTHRGIHNRLLWMQDTYQLTPEDRVLQKTPFSFDVSVWEFFWPLITGARLVVALPGGHQDSAYLIRLINEQELTTLHFVPSMLQVFLEEPGVETCSSLKRVICSGEALPFKLQQNFFARSSAELHNLYGPTEAAVDVTYWACERESQQQIVPIGKPIANTQTYILDKHMEPVPQGVAGELHLGGVQLARGYLSRPALTAERFIPNPFSDEPGERLYRTGDLARHISGGEIEFLGRADNQVKVRGFRIELGEIEAMLLQHEAVREAVVLAREDEPGDKRLVAYLVFSAHASSSEAAPTPALLRAYLKERMPDYMAPSAFVVLDALPLTPNGKVDRRALPAPTATISTHHFLAPRTPLEALLADIWADVLGAERISADDDFFSLGGHSLLATQVISRLRHLVGVEVPLRALFESPTVSGLAARVEAAQRAALGVEAPPLVAAPRLAEPPLSFAQQRLWFLDQLEPGQAAYNMPLAVAVSGALRVAALEQALSEIVRRHEALRTSFPARGGEPRQQIAGAHRVEAPVIDLRGLGGERAWAEARRLAREEAGRPFDLGSGPLLRARLLRLDEEEHVVLLTMHHIVSDGWSMGVLVQEVGTLYESYARGEASPLAELEVQYADYAVWQREWLRGEVLETQLAYWREQLADAPATLELPTDYRRTALQRRPGATLEVRLSAELSAELKALSRGRGVTTFMTLLAGWQVLLSRYAGQERISVGTPIAGRGQLQTEGLIGFFVNTLVLHSDLSGDPTAAELLKRVQEVVLEAYAHQDVPFEKLVEELQPERSLTHSPLFQVMFAFQNAPRKTLTASALEMEMLESEAAPELKFELTLELEDTANGIVGSLVYDRELYAEETIRRMCEHYAEVLDKIVRSPEGRLSDISLLRPEEEHQLLVEWNRTSAEYPRHTCVHELFEQQAARTPDTVALVYGEQHLTYGALDRRANQLARYLRGLGVRPEARVGVLMERSAEMVVGLLAILKAGGAYVPLDLAYPRERLAYMVADSGAEVVLVGGEREREVLGESGARVVEMEAERARIASESGARVAGGDRAAEGLAYVVYTSGSTGTPKGVAVSHASLLNLVNWHIHQFAVTSDDRATQLAGLAFDASVWEIWPYLAAGATLHLVAEETRLSPQALQEWLVSRSITISFLPTPMAERMLSLTWPSKVALRHVLTGGDKLTQYPNDDIPFQLVNNYGPTENTVVTTSTPVRAGDDIRESSPPIGRPIDNVRIYILDAQRRVVPVGVPGEVYIAGENLARGYLKQPAATSERFIADPYSSRAGERMYCSGDVARYKADGNIEFLGRVDSQVKVRGFRIELGEIEIVLSRHPLIGEAIVQVREDVPGDKRLAAYVVAKQPEHVPTSGELREYLKGQLPEYMAPSAFVSLDALPLTPNGKIDRRALPAPTGAFDQEKGIVAPRNAVEEQLTQIWREILGVEAVSVKSNFFEAGGHSLLAVRLMARIEQQWGRNLPLATLFQGGTIEHLATLLDATPTATPWSPLVALHPGGARRPFFCVHPVGGHVLCYAPLASHWDTDRPLYGLQAQGLEAGQVPSGRIDEMARRYIEAIRLVQPEGPYLIGGWSVGGVVAFEMARQLEAQKQEIALLALFDSQIPAGRKTPLGDDVSQLISFAADLGLDIDHANTPWKTLARMEQGEQLALVLDEAKKSQLLPADFAPDDFSRLFNVFKANLGALYDYAPQPYEGKVTLLSASERMEEPRLAERARDFLHRLNFLKTDKAADAAPGYVRSWEELANGGVEWHSVPGNHYTIVREPHVGVLTAQLKDCIERADDN
jgi:amino acid adenylation domain-containing protein